MPHCAAPPFMQFSVGAGGEMADVQSIKLLEPVIIASCGARNAGDVVTSEECGESWEWILDHINYEVVAEPVAVVVTPPAEPVEPESTEEIPAAVVDSAEESPAEVVADVSPEQDVTPDVVPDATETTEVVLNEGDAATVEAVKSVLVVGKSRLKDLLEKTGLTEEVVSPVLIEANGFYVNQQGWYGLVKS